MDHAENLINNPSTTNIAILIQACFSILGSWCIYYVALRTCCKRKRCRVRIQCCEPIPEPAPPVTGNAMPHEALESEVVPIIPGSIRRSAF